ncbi:MAG: AarF/ABC1/UbiB kinase family protein [Candidatus Eremiobacteraeota bacterium]|nr:AarF/ABC1/UbiB kinase family protein [Candidatus Eremiobacteraeota bacterium]
MEEQAPTRSQRYREIIGTFGKHGLAAAGALRLASGERAQSQAKEARLVCEELGPTFIKFGQILSTRGELPAEYREELSKLQDSMPPVDTAFIEAEIESELGAPPQELFAFFDPVPLASASIGQAHLAKLHDGREVVVKVRKPGVRAVVDRDLEILNQLAESSEKYFPGLEDFDMAGIVEEFSDTLRAELDYTREARNIRIFRSFFEDDHGFRLPEVIPEFSTARVLTLTRVDGIKASEADSLSKRRRETAAQRIARFVLEPALLHGIFHADPHPGNILVFEDGTIGAIDFGMVGTLTDENRRRIADILIAMQRHDAERVTDRLLQVAPPSRPIDRMALASELGRLLERYLSTSLARIEIAPALSDMLDLIRSHGLRPPSSLTMFFKTVAMSESIITAVAPERTLADFLRPISEKAAMARLSPGDWFERARLSALDTAELSIDLPRRADRVLADIERGNLRVWARIEDLEPALRTIERVVERANATMLAAACIVGITVLFVVYRPTGWHEVVPWIFWVAVAIVAVTVLRTAWANLKKRKSL